MDEYLDAVKFMFQKFFSKTNDFFDFDQVAGFTKSHFKFYSEFLGEDEEKEEDLPNIELESSRKNNTAISYIT